MTHGLQALGALLVALGVALGVLLAVGLLAVGQARAVARLRKRAPLSTLAWAQAAFTMAAAMFLVFVAAIVASALWKGLRPDAVLLPLWRWILLLEGLCFTATLGFATVAGNLGLYWEYGEMRGLRRSAGPWGWARVRRLLAWQLEPAPEVVGGPRSIQRGPGIWAGVVTFTFVLALCLAIPFMRQQLFALHPLAIFLFGIPAACALSVILLGFIRGRRGSPAPVAQ